MDGGIRLRRDSGRPRADAGAAPVDPADLAWILLLPAVLLALPAIALLAPPGGRLLLPDPGYHYWLAEQVVRKPTVDVAYLMFVVAAVVYAGAIVKLAGMRMRPGARRVLVALAQVAGVAFVLVCWIAQGRLDVPGTTATYFTPATIGLALAAAAAVGLLVRRRAPLAREPLAALRRLDAPAAAGAACLAVALLATLVWLLPAIHTDRAMPAGAGYLNALFYDESAAVLNGRSPLVDMVAYASLWPYAVALPLGAFGGGFAAFTVAMAAITGAALLAVYDILRRVALSPLLALGLYLPVLATSFFVEHEAGGDRYDPGTYFGMFPLRYAGPYLLAWLTARQLGRPAAGRWSHRLLFAAGGLVALNNLDFGGAALAGTAVALVVVRRPRERAALGRLVLDAAAGVGLALAAVSALTLARAGSLPHLGLLLRYGRVFVDGGAVNLPLPGLGLHLVVSATFVAAGAVAAVRVVRAERQDAPAERPDVLAGMLAWCAIFGLGASVYYYAYRSHPDVLVSLFSIWSVTLALLVVAALREAPRPSPWPRAPALALAFAFALAVCSLAQVPSPRSELRRIATAAPAAGSAGFVPPDGFRQLQLTRIVAEQTRAGEPVVIFSPVGHRVAREAGVVNVSPYTGFEQMPAREQLAETIELLRREGGAKVFVAQGQPPGFEAELGRFGFGVVRTWRVADWPEGVVVEYRGS